MRQRIHFCTSGDNARIAYARSGDGPPLVKTAGWLTHLEQEWENPVWHRWLCELSSQHTLVRYDPRGSGLSDRNVDDVDLGMDTWVRDLEAVVDAAGLDVSHCSADAREDRWPSPMPPAIRNGSAA